MGLDGPRWPDAKRRHHGQEVLEDKRRWRYELDGILRSDAKSTKIGGSG